MFTKSNNLDSEKTYQVLDKSNFCQHLVDFPDLILDAKEKATKFVLPATLSKFKNCLILAAGVDKTAVDIIVNFLKAEYSTPVVISDSSDLPLYVNENTLVIAINMAEGEYNPVNLAFRQAGGKNAKLLAISFSGSHLSSLARKFRAPYFEVTYGAPNWLLFPYVFVALLVFFDRLNAIDLEENAIEEAALIVKGEASHLTPLKTSEKNLAKKIAGQLMKKHLIILNDKTLKPIADYWYFQLALTAKELAFRQDLDEWLMAGSMLPDQQKLNNDFYYLVLGSKYEKKADKEKEKELVAVLQKKRLSYEAINIPIANSYLTELFSHLILANFVAYYLAILNNLTPGE